MTIVAEETAIFLIFSLTSIGILCIMDRKKQRWGVSDSLWLLREGAAGASIQVIVGLSPRSSRTECCSRADGQLPLQSFECPDFREFRWYRGT